MLSISLVDGMDGGMNGVVDGVEEDDLRQDQAGVPLSGSLLSSF